MTTQNTVYIAFVVGSHIYYMIGYLSNDAVIHIISSDVWALYKTYFNVEIVVCYCVKQRCCLNINLIKDYKDDILVQKSMADS